MTQALDGIRILDLSWGIAGPLGVLLLAEHGADVIKIEPPGGDPFRENPAYRCWNRSRRSVVLDLKDPDGVAAFSGLVADADVVVESFRPGVLDRLGLGWGALCELNLRVVLGSCPAYPPGHRLADRPGYDALVQASSGQMWEQPGWRMGPIFLHMPMPSMGACYLLAAGVLAALSAREGTGRGQHVQTSLMQGALLYTTQIWQDCDGLTAADHELMAKTYPPGVHQQMLYECAGGDWVHVSVQSGLPPLQTFDQAIGLEDPPEGLAIMAMSAAERDLLSERRRDRIRRWRRDELLDALRSANLAVDAVTPAAEMFRHPQTLANDMAATVADGVVGSTTQIGVPIHLIATPGAIRGPEPSPGEHTEEVLGEGRRPEARPPTGLVAHRTGGWALEGVRVIDFGQYLAGPFAPMVLGDLGADVIKVEPVTGDAMRMASKPFIGCQRGKRSLALDLKRPAGLEVARRLIGGAEVVHHNMTRGVATRLGIGYETCRELRADIIYCNTYAYGRDDPLGRSGGLDPLYQASAGLEFEAGAMAAGQPPLYLRFGMCDASNAMLSVVGVLLALVHRQRTGEGQELWTSLHDGGMLFSSDVWLDAAGDPWDRPPLDAGQHGTDALYRLYRTQDDGWICIAAVTEQHWHALGETVGLGPLASDARLTTRAGRRTHRAELEAGLEEAFRQRTARSWTRALDAAGVPNEIPLDSAEGQITLHDDDNVRLGLVSEYHHARLGRLRQFGALVNLSDTPSRVAGPPPLVGQHSREILRAIGYRDGDIDQLVEDGTVAIPDATYDERYRN